MQRWIALLRGINVGGSNVLPMRELVRDLEALALTNVRTCIQSGNVVFDTKRTTAATLVKQITEQIKRQHGFGPHVLLLSREDLQDALEANPFPDAVAEPQALHFFFLDRPPARPDIRSLDLTKSPSESYVLTDAVLYLHAPDGIGRSKLAATVERHLGVTVTARNYRTVEKLAALVESP